MADEKGALLWKAFGMSMQGCLLALTGKALDAVHMITSGITAYRSTGATLWMPLFLLYLTKAYAELGQFDDACRNDPAAVWSDPNLSPLGQDWRGLHHAGEVMSGMGVYRETDTDERKILSPFNKRECISLKHAADIAGRSESTMRNWCDEYGLGRRIGGGTWVVSKVALAMFLDGDTRALRAYHAGDRSSELVASYFQRLV